MRKEPFFPFVEWADLDEQAREGRRVEARWLLEHGSIVFTVDKGKGCLVSSRPILTLPIIVEGEDPVAPLVPVNE